MQTGTLTAIFPDDLGLFVCSFNPEVWFVQNVCSVKQGNHSMALTLTLSTKVQFFHTQVKVNLAVNLGNPHS